LYVARKEVVEVVQVLSFNITFYSRSTVTLIFCRSQKKCGLIVDTLHNWRLET
jgi:hypothetical protein